MKCISQFYTDQEELENGLICGIKGEMDIPDFSVKASRWHGLKLEPLLNPDIHVVWVNVEAPETKVGTSYKNIEEIEAIRIVLNALTKADGFDDYNKYFKKEEDKEIGIITYYMPQMQKIRESLYPHFTKTDWRNFEQHKYENEFQLPFRINTVDRFQGMERNIIIVSTVRSNKQIIEENGKMTEKDNNNYPKALGFAKELQRVNVGFSRAKRLLIVIGNEKHFSHKSEYAEAIRKMHRIDIKMLQNL
jgi:superfamily I DNA and/or RNA helicase